jgi:hypothetical protein
MSKNDVYTLGYDLVVQATQPATPVSGDPILYGTRPGVCTVSEDANGNCTATFRGVYSLLVDGVDQSGNSAVAAGDRLYYTAGDTIKISKKNTGVPFGYAHGAVASGNHTTKIPVILGT